MVWLLTAAGCLVGRLVPGLAPSGSPHPTLHGSLSDLLSILTTNLRLFSIPFALAVLGFQRSRRARAFGDLLVGAVVTLNALRVGVALGRYDTELIPYIPQLPIEWLALALSTSAWIGVRHDGQLPTLRTRAIQTVFAAAAAAAIEALLTPHVR
ncbi:MAG: hypothetical protein ACYC91_07140 [Solirubrobacteraceae bacterium]